MNEKFEKLSVVASTFSCEELGISKMEEFVDALEEAWRGTGLDNGFDLELTPVTEPMMYTRQQLKSVAVAMYNEGICAGHPLSRALTSEELDECIDNALENS